MFKRNHKRIWLGVALLSAAVLCGGLAIESSAHPAGNSPIHLAATSSSAAPVGPMVSSYAAIVKPVLPEIVNISSTKAVPVRDNDFAPFFNDPFFRQFFGRDFQRRGPRTEREQSLGSGVIVGTNGYILTNNHVVDGATDVRVSLRDKREFKARIVGADPKTDVAVLKIDGDNLPAIPLGDSAKVQVGDVVLAIGNPFGVGQTVTMGIVGATGRGNLGIEDYEDFIQTDAAINPGNSGGALINTSGELIAINTAILTRSGGNQGIGFAIPINLARNVMNQITEHGHVVRGWLGAVIQDVSPAIAKAFGLPQAQGVLVGDLTPSGPAARAGLKTGDVILELNGQPVADASDLRLKISQSAPGSVAHLKVRRGSETQEIPVTLGELPLEAGGKNSAEGLQSDVLRGLSVDDLTPDVRQNLHLAPEVKGVVVTQVDPNSAAATAGMREGDVIVEANRRPVHAAREFGQAMRAAGNEPVLLRILRDGNGFYLVIQQ